MLTWEMGGRIPDTDLGAKRRGKWHGKLFLGWLELFSTRACAALGLESLPMLGMQLLP